MPSQYTRRERLRLGRRPRGAHPRRGQPRAGQPRPLPARLHRLRGAARHLQGVHRRSPSCSRASAATPSRADDLRREVLGPRPLGASCCRTRATPPASWSQGDELARWVARRARARLRAAPRRVLLALRLDRAPPGRLPVESAARYVEDVDRDPVVLFDGLTKNWRYPGWRVTWTIGPRAGHRGASPAPARSSTAAARKPLQRAAIPLLDRRARGRRDATPSTPPSARSASCLLAGARAARRARRPRARRHVLRLGPRRRAAAAAQRRHGLLPRRARRTR